MPTVIVLSSSPPRVFARSATPAGSSSPLPSPSSILKVGLARRKKYKTAPIQRDGFTGGLNGASTFLQARPGGENLPISHAKTDKFNVDASMKTAKRGVSEAVLSVESAISTQKEQAEEPTKHLKEKDIEHGKDATNWTLDLKAENSNFTVCSTQRMQVFSHRLDRTPVPSSAPAQLSSPASPARSFQGGLFGSFGYRASASQDAITTQRTDDGEPTKRRRIDLIETTTAAPLKLPKAFEKAPVGAKKRSRSPAKKAVTITSLATSRYLEEELGQVRVNPILEYLGSTQAKGVGCSGEPASDTAEPKSKSKRSAKKTKNVVSRQLVLSPESALKAIDSQEAMFGFASQLARDESPSFLRDTLEAMKQSESFLSDPVPTQFTQPISIESNTPRSKYGTVRFTRMKNLWAAADRDEDNALLHVDTVDMFDTPTIKQAFAGKDVLLEPEVPRPRDSRSPEKFSPSLLNGQLPFLGSSVLGCFDIDDIKTSKSLGPAARLPVIQTRGLQTDASRSFRIGESTVDSGRPAVQATALSDVEKVSEVPVQEASPKAVSMPKPTKPAFEGFATHDLQKKLSNYGFKPIKKREKMIEILEQCWEAKHGDNASSAAVPLPLAESAQTLTHGDFLSNLHGLSSRPVLKVKKPPGKKKKKKKKDEAVPSVDCGNAKSKPPKTKEEADSNPIAKAQRKTKPKMSNLSTEVAIDVDDIDVPVSAVKASGEADESPGARWKTAIAGALECAPKTKASFERSMNTTEQLDDTVVDIDEVLRPFMFSVIDEAGPTKETTTMTKTKTFKNVTTGNVPRKRRSKAHALSEQIVVDPDDEASAVKTVKAKKAPAKRKVAKAPTVHKSRLATPPPSAYPDLVPTSSPDFELLPVTGASTSVGTSQPLSPSPEMSAQITLAIRSYVAAPDRDHRRNPTWHEKILLYDPIVLEDLAGWLNTEGLGLIGEDREVSGLEVRDWCEARGVCCLWKGGWRGNGGRGRKEVQED